MKGFLIFLLVVAVGIIIWQVSKKSDNAMMQDHSSMESMDADDGSMTDDHMEGDSTNSTSGGTNAGVNVDTSVDVDLGANGVLISDFSFIPQTTTIKSGEKITWTNNDSTTHTVTATDGSFDSGNLARGQTYSFTFTKPGTYSYYCTIHPSMKGTIIVK